MKCMLIACRTHGENQFGRCLALNLGDIVTIRVRGTFNQ
jgi:hypothetical protein